MAFEIQDGTGKGFRAQVDSDKRLHVNSVARTQLEQASLLGEAFNLSTGVMTLTNDSVSAIAFLEYTGTAPFVIKEFLVILGGSTGGSGNGTITVKRNPTAGTIVSSAVAFSTNVNRDFSSAKVLQANDYKGGQGYTLTDGTNFAISTRDTFEVPIAFDAAPIVLRRGNSIGITYQPPSGNTSQTCVVAFTAFIETATVSGDLDG